MVGRRERRHLNRRGAPALGGSGTIGAMITPLHDPGWRGFASDNYAGVHPEVLQALAAANVFYQVS